MTNVTLDTLSNSGLNFIRNCLRQNLTDTFVGTRTSYEGNWIFMGQPNSLPLEYPFVILDLSSEVQDNLTIDGSITINTNFNVHIEVWANKIGDRDTISDQIVKILRNANSLDTNNKTMTDQGIAFRTAIKSNHDVFKTSTELVRIKFIDIDFQYIGSL